MYLTSIPRTSKQQRKLTMREGLHGLLTNLGQTLQKATKNAVSDHRRKIYKDRED